MARRVAAPAAALVAGVLYLLLDVAGGEAGQAPVFYNLPVAIAAWIVMTRSATTTDGDLRSPGPAVMVVIGLALQIKYTVVFKGMFLDLWRLATAHVGGRRAGPLAVDATLWIVAALVPTIAAAGVYAMPGHLDAWMFANVFSILHRGGEQPATVAVRLTVMAALTLPLVLSVALRRWTGWMRAEAAGDAGRWRQQAILGRGRWDADALRDVVRGYVIEHPGADDAVLVIDETGFLKQGKASCGVGRQYTGSAGKVTHCQIGVFAAYVSVRGHAFVDRPLYLPKSWPSGGVADPTPACLLASADPRSQADRREPPHGGHREIDVLIRG